MKERTARAETVPSRYAMAGASAVLLLGGERRSEITRTDETKLRSILSRKSAIPSTHINNSARAEQQSYYHDDKQEGETEDQARNRRMSRWTNNLNSILDSYDNSPAEGFLKGMGISKEKGMNADHIYQKYMVEQDCDVVAFAYEILDKHDARDIRSNMAVIIKLSGNLYGKESAKVVEQLVMGMIEGKENVTRFVRTAKEQIKQAETMPGHEILNSIARHNGEQVQVGADDPTHTEDNKGHTSLTNELAEQDEERFKVELLNLMAHTTEYGKPVWDLLEHHSLVSLANLEVKTTQWASKSKNPDIIILGTEPLPHPEKEVLLFEHRSRSYTDEVIHRLIHEMSHKLHPTLGQALEQVIQHIEQIRETQNNKGLSTIGNRKIYADKGIPHQAEEDNIELVTMYLTEPQYLKRFLDYLASTDTAKIAERENLKLATLTQQEADAIFQAMSKVLKETLKLP